MTESEIIEIERRARAFEERLDAPVYAMLRAEYRQIQRDLDRLSECARELMRIE